MQKYTLSKQAEKDLSEIWHYTVVHWSREQADKYVNGLLDACSIIAKAPDKLGFSYDSVREGYRKYPYRKHIIFYKIHIDGSTFISRVLHEKMDYKRHIY